MKEQEKKVLGFAGFSGSGKTTLIEKLIPLLKGYGFRVAVIKHDAHEFQMDREGKDTFRFSSAGADTVMISSKEKSAVLNSFALLPEDMISAAGDADIVLVEGYKSSKIPKVLVTGNRAGYELPIPLSSCRALISDAISRYEADTDIPLFDINDTSGICRWIVEDIMNIRPGEKKLTHFDDMGNARMVDVSGKDITKRTARAGAKVLLNNETFELIKNKGMKKGDVLTVAQIAGIMGAKKTPELIPMTHPVITDATDVRLSLDPEKNAVLIEAEVTCTGRTGVEMEAICACAAAAMTVYDMCKSVQRDIVITDIRLLSKTGGVHGDYECSQEERS